MRVTRKYFKSIKVEHLEVANYHNEIASSHLGELDN
jgi:hypothetical protein